MASRPDTSSPICGGSGWRGEESSKVTGSRHDGECGIVTLSFVSIGQHLLGTDVDALKWLCLAISVMLPA